MGGKVSSLLTSPSDVLPSYLKEEKLEFSLKMKVMESNPGYLLKFFLLYEKYEFVFEIYFTPL